MQPELSRLGHLAQAGAEAEELVAGDAGSNVGDGQLDVVDLLSRKWMLGLDRDRQQERAQAKETYAVLLHAENVTVAIFEGSDQAFEVGHVVGQLEVVLASPKGPLEDFTTLNGPGTLSNTIFIS